MKRLLLNEKLILAVILLNAVVIFVQESGVLSPWLTGIDFVCSLIFVLEMAVKHHEYGLRGYWREPWNVLDGVLTLIAIPSMVLVFLPQGAVALSSLQVLRVLRVFRFFRLIHFFPNLHALIAGFKKALKDSYPVFAGLLLFILIFSLLSCSLFKAACPQYFDTPVNSIYSIFQLFTIEGWYEIPNAVAAGMDGLSVHAVRLYFCILLFVGGIIGMSLLNSVFVDAMVADNNDELLAKVDDIERKLDRLINDQNSRHQNG